MSEYFLADEQVKMLSQFVRKETLKKAARFPGSAERVVFTEPTPDEVAEVMKLTGIKANEVCLEVGVNGKTPRKWKSGDTKITFAPWRIICELAAARITESDC